MSKTPFLFFILVLFLLVGMSPQASAQSIASSEILGGFIQLSNDVIDLPNDDSFDFTGYLVDVTSGYDVIIRDVTITISKQVQLMTNIETEIIVKNSVDLDKFIIIIPDETVISSDSNWDEKLITPQEVTNPSGTISSSYNIPTSSIQLGSTVSDLVFSKPVTILWEVDITDKDIVFKLADYDVWYIVDGCDASGTYADPVDPSSHNECYVTDNTYVKIITWHFTEFAITTQTTTTPTTPTTPTTTTTSSGGSSGGGSSGGGYRGSSGGGSGGGFGGFGGSAEVIPVWFKDNTVLWWLTGDMTNSELQNAVGYLVNQNFIKINAPPEVTSSAVFPEMSIRPFLQSWYDDKVSEFTIASIIFKYRLSGVW